MFEIRLVNSCISNTGIGEYKKNLVIISKILPIITRKTTLSGAIEKNCYFLSGFSPKTGFSEAKISHISFSPNLFAKMPRQFTTKNKKHTFFKTTHRKKRQNPTGSGVL